MWQGLRLKWQVTTATILDLWADIYELLCGDQEHFLIRCLLIVFISLWKHGILISDNQSINCDSTSWWGKHLTGLWGRHQCEKKSLFWIAMKCQVLWDTCWHALLRQDRYHCLSFIHVEIKVQVKSKSDQERHPEFEPIYVQAAEDQ